jgi:hypothetical protein
VRARLGHLRRHALLDGAIEARLRLSQLLLLPRLHIARLRAQLRERVFERAISERSHVAAAAAAAAAHPHRRARRSRGGSRAAHRTRATARRRRAAVLAHVLHLELEEVDLLLQVVNVLLLEVRGAALRSRRSAEAGFERVVLAGAGRWRGHRDGLRAVGAPRQILLRGCAEHADHRPREPLGGKRVVQNDRFLQFFFKSVHSV